MGYHAPDDKEVTFHAVPFALWKTEFEPGVVDEQTGKQSRFKATFQPVVGAYVAVIRLSAGAQSLDEASWKLQVGRTNDFGWIVRRGLGSLGAENEVPLSGWTRYEKRVAGVADPLSVPEAGMREDYPEPTEALDAGIGTSADLATFTDDDVSMVTLDSKDANAEAISGLPGQLYMIVWCHRESLFLEFLRHYEIAPKEACLRFQGTTYCVEAFKAQTPVSQLRDLSPHEQAFVARVTSRGVEGYHGGWPSRDYLAPAIFDVTPQPLRTLYLCEWAQWASVDLVQNDSHWSYLHALRATIRCAQGGNPIPDLAEKMPTGTLGARAGQVRLYLHALAKEGFRAPNIARSLVDVWRESSLGDWNQNAKSLFARYRLQHPMHDDPPPPAREFKFTEETREALVAYFCMYLLGFDHEKDLAALDAHWDYVQKVVGWVQKSQRELITKLDCVALERAVERSLPAASSEAKRRLMQRFQGQAGHHRVRFWEKAKPQLNSQTGWDAHKPFVMWMVEGSSTLSNVFDEVINRQLARYQDLSPAALEATVQHFFSYHLNLSSEAYEKTLPSRKVQLRLEPDLTRGVAVARVYDREKTTVLAELQLLTEVKKQPAPEVHRPVGTSLKGTAFKMYRRAEEKGAVRSFRVQEVSVSVYDTHAALADFPKMLADAASLFKLATAAGELAVALREKELKDIDAELFISAGQETMASLGTVGDLVMWVTSPLRTGKGKANLLLSGAKRLGAGADLLDAGSNIYEGYTTLASFFQPEGAKTDLAYYLGKQDGVAAFLETIKGTLQVSSGTGTLSSFGARLLGASLTLAGAPIATVVSVGALAVAMTDVMIYLHTGGANPTKDFEFGLHKARRLQFGVAPNQPLPLPDPDQGTTCLLARRLGLVNHILRLS